MSTVTISTTEKKEKMVTLTIPRTREDTSDVYVSVNDRSWLIKRGEKVSVPECVVEVLNNQQIALEKSWDYRDSVEYK